MLLESLPFELPAQTLHLLLGALLGLAFGIAAQISRFCLRRAVAGENGVDRSALSVWLVALAVAIVGIALAGGMGFIELGDHRYLSSSVPVAAIALGGLAFGIGMVLTRGCMSRLTVLAGTGNLRAVSVIALFAIVAHATLKGVLAPVRTSLGAVQYDFGIGSLATIPGVAPAVALALLAVAVLLAHRSGARALHLVMGAVIGLVVVAGWAGTSVLLMDDFDPLPVQSMAFTLPWTDTLFYAIASTAVPAGFGVGVIGGVIVGSFLSAAARGELALHSFESPVQTLRYSAGAVLMGFGGVLAGGCTIGAGLSGGANLSIAALLALGFIVLGAVAARGVLAPRGVAVPAE
ncbi:putative inner membrane protein [Roseovarius sp. THAF9]|uniref:YeeE/YedE family protein n=1 Tax=Roseovarius sp. THAF9 TaxID=2587847 RepID=UPI001267C409|nr:YeeE/YedE family protein [Roseovarius sp. THAF9]QFT94395.1 putative inner membrane protein [Roseovarius sp. THAF9]